MTYEGVAILACLACGGRALTHAQVETILARREMGFTPKQVRLADGVEQERTAHEKLFHGDHSAWTDPDPDPVAPPPRPTSAICPACGNPMKRGFWTMFHRIPVDRCRVCDLIWFDGDELEILQILVERQAG